MNRIEKIFQEKRKVFIGFSVGGDGGIEYSTQCLLKLAEGGVDILEIGMPFSDPCADGVAIQKASKRALEIGSTPEMVLEIGRKIREKSNVGMIFFTYFNPLLNRGVQFLQEIYSAGFDGILIVDLPFDLTQDHQNVFRAIEESGLIPIHLVTPSTSEKRIQRISNHAKGFLYYACRKGTTGIKSSLPDDLSENLLKIKKHTNLPIAIGFGIADRQNASLALENAEGFVVGSAFVQLMEDEKDSEQLRHLASAIDPRENR